jgi:hypothetical protein
VKGIRLGLVSACLCLPLLSGCGSGSSPPFALSCTTHHLRGGKIRASVTIKNTTSATARAFIFSPALYYLQSFRPAVLDPTRVVIDGQQGQTSYIAFIVPRVRPNRPSHLLLTFSPPPPPRWLAVTNARVVQASDSSPPDNPDCVIQ